ncbi:hypothetical protein Ait01nite_089870 [Actinoplanes italicus]|uniref:Uncharacterized protein n=1 Tax=Actinoplanes italicus TaxID=113567 RepID=A0A2T0JIJ3_9ACTN|nr:hypothetical protein [Actinoplanes italicus]PRX07404.1 hypothetical protein CLV67_14279 [Actinoplanes italicus]GIE35942.1 hypothetical protein Ait01nite_089870 [Actinoplanes italicus]
MTKFLANLAVVAISWLLGAWAFMIGVGVAHAEWWPTIPTIGYKASLILGAAFALRGAISGLATGLINGVNGGAR